MLRYKYPVQFYLHRLFRPEDLVSYSFHRVHELFDLRILLQLEVRVDFFLASDADVSGKYSYILS